MKRVQDGIRRARQFVWKLCSRLGARSALASVAVAVGYFIVLQVTDSERGSVVARQITIREISGEVIAAVDNELRNERLSDGSTVAMAPGTRMQFDFSGPQRIVNLHRGKARFTVAHNPEKPFTVQTHLVDATALGTSFTVSVTDCVGVQVHDGVVEISGRGVAKGLVRTLKAGDSIDLSQNCSFAVLAESLTPF